MIERLTTRAIDLLKKLIKTQSFSSEEQDTAVLIEHWFKQHNIAFHRTQHNV
ncbi:MAG: acetylornithine deacetylase, partial [Nonlabens sp.]|nr:acetylornithine deacetylase [Nonlabens sp.]